MGLFDNRSKNELEKDEKKDDIVTNDEGVHITTQGNSGSSFDSGSDRKFGTTGSVRKLREFPFPPAPTVRRANSTVPTLRRKLSRKFDRKYVYFAICSLEQGADVACQVGGTVGTALFVYMGVGLVNGGPLNLLLGTSSLPAWRRSEANWRPEGYIWWTSVIWAVAEGQTEMVAQWPTDAAFSRYASRYIDESIGSVALVETLGSR